MSCASLAGLGALGCIKLLLAKGANPSLACMSGEVPAEVAPDSETRKALQQGTPGLKRKRSSSNSMHLEASLPLQVDALYEAVQQKDLAAVKALCVDAVGAAVASWATGSEAAAMEAGVRHVSSNTKTVHVDVKLGGKPAVHQLRFDEDGLVVNAQIFRAA